MTKVKMIHEGTQTSVNISQYVIYFQILQAADRVLMCQD